MICRFVSAELGVASRQRPLKLLLLSAGLSQVKALRAAVMRGM